MILDDLVFHDTHSGLGNCGFGEGDPCFVCSRGGGQKNSVHLFLGVVGVLLLRPLYSGNFRFQCFNGIDDRIVSTQK